MRFLIFLIVITALVLVMPAHAVHSKEGMISKADDSRDIQRVMVFDGSGVHDIGELLLHTGNWGVFGSYPNTGFPVSEFPSAEWPAGSGVEHLYISGIWIGSRMGGIPAVSTSAFEMEFRPTDSPYDRIYEAFEGAPGGMRLPSPMADDDGDGLIDEDWLNGRDDDGDGLIDEDFAAISGQMFSSWYTDDQPDITNAYPEHEPMHVMVRQESYQWTDPRFDDFVGIKFTIANTGMEPLDRFYFGFMMDGDIGRRGDGSYWEDDAAGSWQGIRCTELGPASISMGYMYDADGDGGAATSYFGAMFLGHVTDSEGTTAPARVGMTSFQIFRGDQPFENGGDPVNDFERYESMAIRSTDRNTSTPGDYRTLVSTGPFSLPPGETLDFHMGLVAGDGLEGLLDNAAMCQVLFNGMWFDVDDDPVSGVDGRETPVWGPVTGIDPDLCDDDYNLLAAARGEILWINADCALEQEYKEYCSYTELEKHLYMTGIEGRETRVNWISEWSPMLQGTMDIKPGTCKNPFNIKNFEFTGSGNPHKGGVMPVAILGREGFDVSELDISTIRLNGVAPLGRGQSICDVAGPGENEGMCHCAVEGPDGYEDLLLKFSNQEIAATRAILSIPEPGDVWTLTMTGELGDGTGFQAHDCVTLVGEPPQMDKPDRPTDLAVKSGLVGSSPNPFNPSTTIAFNLGEGGHVILRIFDAAGRLVRTLVDEERPAGSHEVTWNGLDDQGARVTSGIYFCRFSDGEVSETRKMVLLR